MTKIAFLGLGQMGSRMCERLLQSQNQVAIWNRTHKEFSKLVKGGAILNKNLRETVSDADVIITMLRDDAASSSVWNEALECIKPGAISVECSTLSYTFCKSLKPQFCERASPLVFAPLAGSLPQAEAGKLIFMASGDQNALNVLNPVLNTMGSQVMHVGSDCEAAIFKLMVNCLLGIQVLTYSELMNLAEKYGLNTSDVHELVSSIPVVSPALKAAGESIVLKTFKPNFPIDLVEKDLSQLKYDMENCDVKKPIVDLCQSIFKECKNLGYGADNITGVSQYYQTA